MQEPMREGEHVVGVDVGGTKTMALVFNDGFHVTGRCKKKTVSKKKPDEPVIDRITRIVEEALEEADNPEILGIGVGSPGPLDPNTGVVIDTPNLGWKDFPLGELLAERFNVPVSVDNDVNMGTYGEWRFGAVSDCQDVLGVFPGTGIGGGIIIGGRLHHGFSGAAGEFGHMTVEMDGPLCGCGKRGCLEAVASRIAIATEVAAAAARNGAPWIFENCGTDLHKIKSGALKEAIDAGDAVVENIVRRAAFYTGMAIGNLVNALSPEAVVLGGGLVEAMEDLYMQESRAGMDAHAMPFLRRGVRLVAARLGDDAVAQGAAYRVTEQVRAAGD